MDNTDIEQQAWQLVQAHLAQATPEQWHVFAARSHYDGNFKGLQWLVDQRDLDRATALLIYWYLGAAWYVQYVHEDEVTDPATFRLLRLIEERYAGGYYPTGDIWFDPRHSDGGGPHDYPDVPVKRPIPPLMLEPVQGSNYVAIDEDPEGFDEGLPLAVVDALYGLHDRD